MYGYYRTIYILKSPQSWDREEEEYRVAFGTCEDGQYLLEIDEDNLAFSTEHLDLADMLLVRQYGFSPVFRGFPAALAYAEKIGRDNCVGEFDKFVIRMIVEVQPFPRPSAAWEEKVKSQIEQLQQKLKRYGT